MYFIVEPNRDHLVQVVRIRREGGLRPLVGAVRPLDQAPQVFREKKTTAGKTVIHVA